MSVSTLVDLYRDERVSNAFGELVRRFQSLVYRTMLGMTGESALADALSQRAFVRAARGLDELREPEAFRAWLLAIVREVVFDELARPRHDDGQATADADSGSAAVRWALSQMDPADRFALIVVELESVTLDELAEAFAVTTAAAAARCARARADFAQLHAANKQARSRP